MSSMEDPRGVGSSSEGDGARSDGPRAMDAVIRRRYGTLDETVRVERVGIPPIREGEVLVRVAAAGIDRGVWHLMTGLPYPVRLAGYGFRTPKNPVLGADMSGRVEAVGSEVVDLKPGDEVFGIGEGSLAEFARARPDKLAPKPAGLDFKQAAAIPVSGLAALQGLRDQAEVSPGARVLIIGASGGVGSFAVQIAKAFGAEVTAVASGGKAEMVRSLGADDVIDYQREAIADAGKQYDVILDTGGNRPLLELRRALSRRGRLVIVGGENGGRWLGGTDRQLRAMAVSPFIGQTLGTFISSENAADLKTLSELCESGRVTPFIDRSFTLREAPEAIRYMQGGRARGKVVVDV